MRILLIVVLLVTDAVAATDTEATQRIFGRYSQADRLVVQRGALCHPNRVKMRVIAEVVGLEAVREVLIHLSIEKRQETLTKAVDEDTGEEIFIGGPTIIFVCPDYTLFFYRGDKNLGTIGLVGILAVKADGEKKDQWLTEHSRAFLHKRFGLVDEPAKKEEKTNKTQS